MRPPASTMAPTPSGFPLAVVYTPGEIGVPVHPAVSYGLLLDLAIFGVLAHGWFGASCFGASG